ncbi:solute carrier organic anion transporter family member 74D-like isoform X2 [Macrobrachium nipponense]|uniref:solute carrier organic anion transporter family member 74D-like isoform X2 n=1 Tax=Macrobrachium nipponense TaxID=159736 RepID=UPI0030C7ACB3
MHKGSTVSRNGEADELLDISLKMGTAEGSFKMVDTGKMIFTEEEQKSIECGLGFFRPRWLQIFACKPVPIMAFSAASIVQGMFFTYTVAVISTLEKRFKLTSLQIGIVLAGNDISAIMFAPFLGYYLNSRHRPRWLGLGILMTAVSCFMTALPHFIYGPGEVFEEELVAEDEAKFNVSESYYVPEMEGLCGFKREGDPCSAQEDRGKEKLSALGPLVIIFVSQFIAGISMSVFYCIGISYVDDNVSKKTTSVYYSFLIIGSVLVVIGIGFAFLPFQLPATLMRKKRKLMNLNMKDEGRRTANDAKYIYNLMLKGQRQITKPTLKNMMRVTKKLFGNKVWLANAYNLSVFLMAVSGYKIFMPKYMENQFRQSASDANFYVGAVSLSATCLGTVIAGAVLRFARPGPRVVIGFNIFVTILFCFLYLLKMLVKCPPLEASGSPLDGGLGCSSSCICITKFSPVCSEDNTTLFYSPCSAGCTMVDVSVNPKVYGGCTCIRNNSTFTSHSPTSGAVSIQNRGRPQFGTATKGYCPESCDAILYYLVLETIGTTALATGKIGTTIIHLRAVDDQDKGLSIGILEVFLALFGFIPGPLIMGKIVDSSCVIWEERCGVQGNCWLYDTDKFRILLHSFAAGLVFLSLFGDLVMFKYGRSLDLYGETETALPLGPADENSGDSHEGTSVEAN